MKAITVKYLPPATARGARLKASDSDGNSVTIKYPDLGNNGEEKHFEAVKALCAKMDWHGEVVCGWAGNQSVWVWTENAERRIV